MSVRDPGRRVSAMMTVPAGETVVEQEAAPVAATAAVFRLLLPVVCADLTLSLASANNAAAVIGSSGDNTGRCRAH